MIKILSCWIGTIFLKKSRSRGYHSTVASESLYVASALVHTWASSIAVAGARVLLNLVPRDPSRSTPNNLTKIKAAYLDSYIIDLRRRSTDR